MYQCDNGKCISSSLYCDFEDHCGDNSDESYCGKYYKMLDIVAIPYYKKVLRREIISSNFIYAYYRLHFIF